MCKDALAPSRGVEERGLRAGGDASVALGRWPLQAKA